MDGKFLNVSSRAMAYRFFAFEISWAMTRSRLLLLVICLLAFSQSLRASSELLCGKFDSRRIGDYVVQTDYWNAPKCPGEQCIRIDSQKLGFRVVKDDFNCGYDVASYPSILYGTAWGVSSGAKDLPASVGSLQKVQSDWSFRPAYNGAWDAAYDIWFCPNHQCGTADGFNGGTEIMIWLDYYKVNGWKKDYGEVQIDGRSWELWGYEPLIGKSKWQYLAYLLKQRSDSVKGLDVLAFMKDAEGRGFLKPNWFLYAILVGNEFHSGGLPFSSDYFSVCVNQSCRP
jgi:hypothetical protein